MAELVRMLVDDFGATRIPLFGSSTRGASRRGGDLDLLVEGIPYERIIAATARADRPLAEKSKCRQTAVKRPSQTPDVDVPA